MFDHRVSSTENLPIIIATLFEYFSTFMAIQRIVTWHTSKCTGFVAPRDIPHTPGSAHEQIPWVNPTNLPDSIQAENIGPIYRARRR